ncbi:energy-coupling factor transporter transmembrane component T family protein [Crenobacter intestini]|uniref:Cobalt ECF transporter T component CbiQ n=1 Tax=Crenobacter intestini TaxID=2563443 RepID=A0A4T0UQ95_9NEIS|nr:energy-coupling factor transporter transmembrane component T [Crenobacter intestini]TIC80525.1 cobalt ECF transporter T component CbiQ [Crenobacter intestini]
MTGLAHALSAIRRADSLASRPTRAAAIDARAKLLATLWVVGVLASFPSYEVARLLPLALFPVVLLVMGEVPLSWLCGRLLLALPFVLMVGALNPWLDPDPLPSPWGGAIAAGWFSLASILLRGLIAVSSALLLLATTGIIRISYAMSCLGLPAVLVNQVLFLYRYLFVVGEELARTVQAWQLRGAGKPRRGVPPHQLKLLLASVLTRTFQRAMRIHQAMLARGFDGKMRLARLPRWRWRDTGFLLFWIIFPLLARQVDIPLMLGRLLTGA